MASEPTVEITHEEKIYPEEDYEYEGTVNGKEWEAEQTLGMGASIYLSTPEGVELTEQEKEAVYETLWNR